MLDQRVFVNDNFARKLCAFLPKATLENLEDLREARYSEAEIMEALNLPLIPPKDLVFQFLGRCYRCGLHDHLRANCPGVCPHCQILGFKCVDCEGMTDQMPIMQSTNISQNLISESGTALDLIEDSSLSGPLRCCYRCLDLGHMRKDCTKDFKCLGCYGLGHKIRSCPLNQHCSFCHRMGHETELCPKIRCR